jgi:hypothetical protein
VQRAGEGEARGRGLELPRLLHELGLELLHFGLEGAGRGEVGGGDQPERRGLLPQLPEPLQLGRLGLERGAGHLCADAPRKRKRLSSRTRSSKQQ